jgi:hypothetical protein
MTKVGGALCGGSSYGERSPSEPEAALSMSMGCCFHTLRRTRGLPASDQAHARF